MNRNQWLIRWNSLVFGESTGGGYVCAGMLLNAEFEFSEFGFSETGLVMGLLLPCRNRDEIYCIITDRGLRFNMRRGNGA